MPWYHDGHMTWHGYVMVMAPRAIGLSLDSNLVHSKITPALNLPNCPSVLVELYEEKMNIRILIIRAVGLQDL